MLRFELEKRKKLDKLVYLSALYKIVKLPNGKDIVVSMRRSISVLI